MKYSDEFKRDAVALVKAGATQREVYRDLGISKSALSKWVADAERAERGQVRGRESKVEHAEVFRDGKREELPSSGRPRLLPDYRRVQPSTP
ncbi:transposase [Populibacterium corticicola]|uniref:Transposase n=1 Tax=Populibacterium corticicola TaxID=1812826 RepID=A0ABW5XEG2_9MICO